MRLFLDANLLFSAARADGAVRRLLALLLAEGHVLCIDAYVLQEARRNLAAKAPAGLAWLEERLSQMEYQPTRARDLALEKSLPLVDKDRPVLAAAIRSGCDILVTGDRTHFGALFGTTVHGVKVLSPALVAEEWL